MFVFYRTISSQERTERPVTAVILMEVMDPVQRAQLLVPVIKLRRAEELSELHWQTPSY